MVKKADGVELGDFFNGGLMQIQALVHYYFKEEPDSFERLALLWGRLKFALQFEDKIRIKDTKRG